MSKIAIIGAGNVGATMAYTLALSGTASEIALIDINETKARGEALDKLPVLLGIVALHHDHQVVLPREFLPETQEVLVIRLVGSNEIVPPGAELEKLDRVPDAGQEQHQVGIEEEPAMPADGPRQGTERARDGRIVRQRLHRTASPAFARPPARPAGASRLPVFGEFRIRIDVLHVVVLFQRINQSVHRRRLLFRERDGDRGQRRDLRHCRLDVPGFELLVDGFELRRLGQDLVASGVGPEILRPRLQRHFHQLVFIGVFPRHDDLAFALEQPADGALRGKAPPVPADDASNLGGGAVAIVRADLDEQGDAVRRVDFVGELLVLRRLAAAGSAFDGALDVLSVREMLTDYGVSASRPARSRCPPVGGWREGTAPKTMDSSMRSNRWSMASST